MKALIFGINGQDGIYLSGILEKRGISVTGVSRSSGQWLKGDVGNTDFVINLVKTEKPDYIFHLAANSRTHHSLLREHQSTIVNGSLNILEAISDYSPASKVFITGSGLQFQNSGHPINEETPFEANDVYSLARIQSVYAARYFRSKGLKIYTGYLFHHDSPYRNTAHLNRRIADAAKAASNGKPEMLTIGDISVEKEFGYAGDIASGIFRLVEQDDLFEACIGTGKAFKIEKWLDLCFSHYRLNWKNYVQPDPAFRPEFKKLVSDPQKMNQIGWEAKTGIEKLASLMLESV